MTKRLIFIFCSAFALTVQGQKGAPSLPSGTAVSSHPGMIAPGTELIVEGQKIGRFAPRTSTGLNIVISKSKDRSGNVVQKDVVIGDIVEPNMRNGLIDISEIDYAISALEYIRDSLLPQKPGNEFTYTKNFIKSNLQIMAWFDPAAGKSAQWGMGLMRDKNFPDSFLLISKSDLPDLISALETSKEKLKNF